MVRVEHLADDLEKALLEAGYDLTDDQRALIHGKTDARGENRSKHRPTDWYYDDDTRDLVARRDRVHHRAPRLRAGLSVMFLSSGNGAPRRAWSPTSSTRTPTSWWPARGELLVPLAFLLQRVSEPAAARRLAGDLVVADRGFAAGIGAPPRPPTRVHAALAEAPPRLGPLLSALYRAVAEAAGARQAGTLLTVMGNPVLNRTGLYERASGWCTWSATSAQVVATADGPPGPGGDRPPVGPGQPPVPGAPGRRPAHVPRWSATRTSPRDPRRGRGRRARRSSASTTAAEAPRRRRPGPPARPGRRARPRSPRSARRASSSSATTRRRARRGGRPPRPAAADLAPPAGASAGGRRPRDRAVGAAGPAARGPRRASDEALAPAACNVCRWTGEAFAGQQHAESADCPRCGSIARERFHLHGLGPDAGSTGRRRSWRPPPRLSGSYARAMGRWFDYTVLEPADRRPVRPPGRVGRPPCRVGRPGAQRPRPAHGARPRRRAGRGRPGAASRGRGAAAGPACSPGPTVALDAADTAAAGHRPLVLRRRPRSTASTPRASRPTCWSPTSWPTWSPAAPRPGPRRRRAARSTWPVCSAALAEPPLTPVADRPTARRCGWIPAVLFVTFRGAEGGRLMFVVYGMPRSGTTLAGPVPERPPRAAGARRDRLHGPRRPRLPPGRRPRPRAGRCSADLIAATDRFDATLGRWLTPSQVREVVASGAVPVRRHRR